MTIATPSRVSAVADVAALTRDVGPHGAGVPIARDASAGEVASWDVLVRTFPGSRVTHGSAWLHYLSISVPHSQVVRLVVERAGSIVGCVAGLLTRVGPFTLFGSPLPGWQTPSMGPLYDPTRADATDVVGSLLRHLEGAYGVQHVELVSDRLDASAMQRLGFRGQAVPTFRAPLYPDDRQRTFGQLKDSARRNVRRAERLGLRLQFDHAETFAAEVHHELDAVFVRGGHVVPFGPQRVTAFTSSLGSSGNLIAAAVRLPETDELVACGLFTSDGHELLLWQWAHRPSRRWYRATEFMTWAVMCRAMDGGCTTFDLMGEGDFKAHFGANLEHRQVRWIRSRYAWLTTMRDAAEWLYRSQQAMRGRCTRWARGTAAALPAPLSGADL